MTDDTLTQLDNFYLQKNEPVKGCLLALRQIILKQDADITAAWKYGMPFFCYKGKMFCYLWVHKKLLQPYIGIVEGKRFDHPGLIIEKRARMKIMLFDAGEDLPVETIEEILKLAIDLYKTGMIKIR
ncbi:DUF1801 domain-containing protein [Mucilaginibacter ginsenosidivorax]|uniref:DUF1801 domain-containing protein n=1 Tax=Mucilaginibacter ginsenosidivorax TaxID=862126 RepID=A0A5B8W434_9SPHI|nr:DUF1801 domain-containing protein [Mucilaginibacter ginsenosidivorax]QEC78830.1 DUF1801 domain-containing protein [Mucilaginibacter ginsenosidivorax]